MFPFIVNSWLSLWVKPKVKHYLQAKYTLNLGSTQQKKTIWSWRANHLIIIKLISYKKPSYNNLKPFSKKNHIFNLATTLLFSFDNGNQMCTKCKSKAVLYIAAPVFMAMSTGFQERGFVWFPMAANLAFS